MKTFFELKNIFKMCIPIKYIIDHPQSWKNLAGQTGEVDEIEEEFEGIQTALEERGCDLSAADEKLEYFELEPPPKEIVQDDKFEEFYEKMEGSFREYRATGRLYQIYNVRCVWR